MEPGPALCRDCFTEVPAARMRCTACGSPRLVRHPELPRLAVAHIDCDAFYATIEKRDAPELADLPVIIGGGRRGVVATACYVARIYGVRSAMPMFKARELCPDAVVIRPNMEKYVAVGRQVREAMRSLTPLVEPLSIDEAFLDLSGTEKLHGEPPAWVLARLAARIEREIGISVSIGLSQNKFLAKIASDLDKPRGFSVLARAEAAAFLAPRPVGFIWGVGPATAQRLADEGYRTIADLQRADARELARRFGSEGLRLARLAFGDDDRKVTPDRPMKSVSAETTFDTDVADAGELERRLWRLCEKVSARLKAMDIAGRTVTLKLKTTDFRSRTRARGLPDPTQLAGRIFDVGRDLLAHEADGSRFRLIGIGVSDLAAAHLADPRDLVDEKAGRSARAEHAMDSVRARFGKALIERGLVYDGSSDTSAPATPRKR